jgi:hypothetical protein
VLGIEARICGRYTEAIPRHSRGKPTWVAAAFFVSGTSWHAVSRKMDTNVTSVADVSPNRRTTYYYRVLAFNEAGYSAPTNVVVVRTPSFGALL